MMQDTDCHCCSAPGAAMVSTDTANFLASPCCVCACTALAQQPLHTCLPWSVTWSVPPVQVPVLTLVASSGLLHALLEGMLLVLGTDQAAYLQGGQEEQDMYLDMLWHSHKASMLLLRLGGR